MCSEYSSLLAYFGFIGASAFVALCFIGVLDYREEKRKERHD